MTVTASVWPLCAFRGGPAAGDHLVYPAIDGELPSYVTVPVEGDPWLVEAAIGQSDPRPPEHLYKRVDHGPTSVYLYVITLGTTALRITCPRCGMTSYNPGDVADGYCGNCHARTRLPMYAVLRADFPLTVWERRWRVRSEIVGLIQPADGDAPGWAAEPTGMFERGPGGGFAEIFEARPLP